MGRGLWEGPEVRDESSEERAVVLRRPSHIPRAWGAMEVSGATLSALWRMDQKG